MMFMLGFPDVGELMMTDLTARTRWEVLPSLPTPRAYSAAIQINEVLYVIGGCNRMGQPLDAVESFSLETNTWRELHPLKVKRAQPIALVFQGKIVVIGGCKEMNQPVKEVRKEIVAIMFHFQSLT